MKIQGRFLEWAAIPEYLEIENDVKSILISLDSLEVDEATGEFSCEEAAFCGEEEDIDEVEFFFNNCKKIVETPVLMFETVIVSDCFGNKVLASINDDEARPGNRICSLKPEWATERATADETIKADNPEENEKPPVEKKPKLYVYTGGGLFTDEELSQFAKSNTPEEYAQVKQFEIAKVQDLAPEL